MTDEQRRAAVLRTIAEYTTANTTSQQVARAALIREGIYTEDGKLRREYGGPGADDKAKPAA